MGESNGSLMQLPRIDASELVPPGIRAVIVAPHPDDEVLGCGGLLAQLALLQREILLIAVSDGENSHASDSSWSVDLLARIRPNETAAALLRLGINRIAIVRAQLPDGALAQHRAKLDALLKLHLRPSDMLFASWRMDGRPDHEAVGRAAAAASHAIGCKLIEMPIRARHEAQAENYGIAWKNACKLPLDHAIVQKKKAALQCYRSQIVADLSTGRPPILPDRDLAHFYRPYEVYIL